MSKKSIQDKSIYKIMAEIVISVYVVMILCVFPMLFKNGYTDILEVKTNFYYIVTAVTFGLEMMIGVSWLLWKENGQIRRLMTATDIMVIIFIAAVSISWLLNGNKQDTFWGTYGRNVGYLLLVTCVIGYFLVSRIYRLGQGTLIGIMLSATLVFLLAVCNHLGYDPLGMFELFDQKSKFISTMGNRNCVSAFLGILLPFGMTLYFVCEKGMSKHIYRAFCISGFLGITAINCDGAYVAVIFSFIIILWFAFESWEKLLRYTNLLVMYGGATLAMRLLRYFRGEENCFYLEGIPELLLYSWIVPGIIAIGIIMKMVVSWCSRRSINENILKILKKAVFLLLIAVIIIIIMMVCCVNIRMTQEQMKQIFGGWTKYIYISDAWGTNRIKIWKVSCQTYAKFPFINKLFGYGPAGFYYAINDFMTTQEVNQFNGTLIDAHNEGLQYLITTGIVGVVSYFGIFISAFILFWKETRKNKYMLAFAVVVVGFLVQGCMNNVHIYITPLIFTYIAIGQAVRK